MPTSVPTERLLEEALALFKTEGVASEVTEDVIAGVGTLVAGPGEVNVVECALALDVVKGVSYARMSADSVSHPYEENVCCCLFPSDTPYKRTVVHIGSREPLYQGQRYCCVYHVQTMNVPQELRAINDGPIAHVRVATL